MTTMLILVIGKLKKKSSSKEIHIRYSSQKNAQKTNQNGKNLENFNTKIKGQEFLKKKQERTTKTLKESSSVEDIKAEIQASIEKDCFPEWKPTSSTM